MGVAFDDADTVELQLASLTPSSSAPGGKATRSSLTQNSSFSPALSPHGEEGRGGVGDGGGNGGSTSGKDEMLAPKQTIEVSREEWDDNGCEFFFTAEGAKGSRGVWGIVCYLRRSNGE